MLRIKNAAPIDLRIFTSMIPENYAKNLGGKNLGKRTAQAQM